MCNIMPGVNGLSPNVKCNGKCLISLQDTSRGRDHVIEMYDSRCYYTKYIYMYITNLIKKGLKLDNPNFVLPTRTPITKADLDLLYLDPNNFDKMHEEWLESPAHAVEQAQLQSDALRAAMEASEADIEYIEVLDDGNGMHEVDTVLRWGVQVERDEAVELPIYYINRVDHFLLPAGYDNNFNHNDDENIGRRRIRNIGVREIEYIGIGQPVPEGLPLVIRFNNDFYNTLEELAEAMGRPVAEITINLTGGKRKTKRRGKRNKSRRR